MRHKILYLDKSSEIGGAETSLLLLLKHLDRNKYTTVVALPAEGTLNKQLRALGVQVITTPLHTVHLKGLNPLPYLSTVWRLVKIIRREGVDLVHANDTTTNQYGVVAAKLSGVPIICHLRSLSRKSDVVRGLLPWTDHLIANSYATARTYLACKGTPEKVTVIYNGVDLADYCLDNDARAKLRKHFNVSDETFLMGIVGRVTEAKGHHVLIQALAAVRNMHDDVCLAVIGPLNPAFHSDFQRDTRFVTELRQLIATLGLDGHVSFWGEQRSMAPIYQALDLLVVSTFEESFGRVLIEAMAVEKPVIASAVGAIPEIIDDSMNGLLIPPGDVPRLAEAICAVKNDPGMGRRMGKEGRRRVEKFFSIESNVAQTEALYQRVIHRCGPRSII